MLSYLSTRGPAHGICAWVGSLGLACDQGHLLQLPAADPAPYTLPPAPAHPWFTVRHWVLSV